MIADIPQNGPGEVGAPTPCPGLPLLHTLIVRQLDGTGDGLSKRKKEKKGTADGLPARIHP